MINDFMLDDFVWSFSRIETYERCNLCFYLQYIKCVPSISGCFGQYGTLIHNCLEKYALGELAEYELSSEYKNNYSKIVTEDFPPNAYVDLGEKYYNQGLEYFNTFEGFGDRKILGIEQEYKFKIGDYNFTGVIDLECSGEIIDHKTKGKQDLKRLTKKHKKEDYVEMLDGRLIHKDNYKQLYVYSMPFKEKYGDYPKILSLNMAKIQDWYSIKFNDEHFEESRQWILSNIKDIYNTEKFVKGDDTTEFWCNHICGVRLSCKYSDKYLGVEACE